MNIMYDRQACVGHKARIIKIMVIRYPPKENKQNGQKEIVE